MIPYYELKWQSVKKVNRRKPVFSFCGDDNCYSVGNNTSFLCQQNQERRTKGIQHDHIGFTYWGTSSIYNYLLAITDMQSDSKGHRKETAFFQTGITCIFDIWSCLGNIYNNSDGVN